jgi:hypothetical protein
MDQNSHTAKPQQSNPYCAYRSDLYRLLAMVSRDVRLVAVAIVSAYAGSKVLWSAMTHWFG